MDWLFEADRDPERRFPWISIPGVASIVYRVKWMFGMRNDVFGTRVVGVAPIGLGAHLSPSTLTTTQPQDAKSAKSGRNAAMASTTWMTNYKEGGAFFNSGMNRTANMCIA